MRWRGWFLVCFLLSVLTLGTLRTAIIPLKIAYCASCSTPNPTLVNGQPVTWGNITSVSVYTDLTGSERNDVAAAVQQWNAAGSVPQMQLVNTGDPGDRAPGFIRIVSDPTANALMQQNAPTTNLITSVTINYNKSYQITDPTTGNLVNAYTPVLNNGDQFFTDGVAHELGHALGLDDFRDASGNPIDSQTASVMGEYIGNNNQGFSAYYSSSGNYVAAQPPGKVSNVTNCDMIALYNLQNPPSSQPQSAGGGNGRKSGGSGSGSGGSGGVCYDEGYDEYDDTTSTTTHNYEYVCSD